MVHVCQFCNREFTYKNALNKHLISAKYCLKERKNQSNICCQYCAKKFIDDSSLSKHQLICKVKILHEDKNRLQVRCELLEKENSSLKVSEQSLRKKIAYLEGQKDEAKNDKERYYTTIEKAALDKKTVTTNQYNNLITFPVDLSAENIRKKSNAITLNTLRKGQEGLADFFIDRIATNEKGEVGVICTNLDYSVFKYMAESGEIITDFRAQKIIENFKTHSKLKIDKSLETLWEEYEEAEDREDKNDKLDEYNKIFDEVKAFGGPFVRRLVSRTYRKVDGNKLVKVNPPSRKVEEVKEYKDPISDAQYNEWLERMN